MQTAPPTSGATTAISQLAWCSRRVWTPIVGLIPPPPPHPTPPQLTRARAADPLLPISIQQHAPPWMPDRLQSSYLLHQGDTTVAPSPASAVGGQGPQACLRNTRRGAASPRKATPRGPRACIPPLWPPLAPLRATTARSRAAAAAPALPAADGRGLGQRPRRRQRRHRGRVYLRRGVLLPLAPAPGTAHPGVSGCGRHWFDVLSSIERFQSVDEPKHQATLAIARLTTLALQ